MKTLCQKYNPPPIWSAQRLHPALKTKWDAIGALVRNINRIHCFLCIRHADKRRTNCSTISAKPMGQLRKRRSIKIYLPRLACCSRTRLFIVLHVLYILIGNETYAKRNGGGAGLSTKIMSSATVSDRYITCGGSVFDAPDCCPKAPSSNPASSQSTIDCHLQAGCLLWWYLADVVAWRATEEEKPRKNTWGPPKKSNRSRIPKISVTPCWILT